MQTSRIFRYLWRINAVLIALVTGGVGVTAAVVMLAELSCNVRHRRAVDAAPTVVADPSERLYLGELAAVDGTNVLRGELMDHEHGLGMSSGSYRGEIRNLLYLDTTSNEAHWLLPDSTHVLTGEITVWSKEGEGKKGLPIAQVALVKPQSADIQLAEGALIIFDPSGRTLVRIAEGVRALNHASLLENQTILVIFERGRRYVRAVVDTRSFKTESIHDISVPELR